MDSVWNIGGSPPRLKTGPGTRPAEAEPTVTGPAPCPRGEPEAAGMMGLPPSEATLDARGDLA